MEQAIRARVEPVAWSCLPIIVLAGTVRAVSLPVDRSLQALAGFGWVIVATGVAGAVVVLLLFAWCRFLPDPVTIFGRSLQIAVAMVPGAWVLIALLAPSGLSAVRAEAFVWIAVALTAEAIAAWWVVGGLLRDWTQASTARERLSRSLAAEQQMNELLAEAERDRFGSYGEVVAVQIEEPLVRLVNRADDLGSVELADAIDTMIITVMRPLAHLIHPVSVRTGLIPAIRALGPHIAVVADPGVIADDAAGRLLDEDVRLQVYRWIRFLRPSADAVTLTMSVVDGSFHVAGSGVAEARPLDPMQRVAGLRVDSSTVLRVPLRGAPPQPAFEEAPRSAAPRRRGLSMRLLGTSPVVDMRLAAVITLVTAPAQFFLSSFDTSGARFVSVIAAMVVSMLAALALSRIPAPRSGAACGWWAVGAWSGIGLASGLTTLIVAAGSVQEPVTRAIAVSLLIRGTIRYALPGLLFQLARGLAGRAVDDTTLLSASLASVRERRTELLSNAESTERFLSESLHRTVQGRLSAISLLLRLERREEAVAELEVLCRETVPELLQRLMLADVMSGGAIPLMRAGDLGLEITDRVDWPALRRQDPVIARELRRVVDECAVNARRHGQATSMRVYLTREAGRMTLHCDDDGIGISDELVGGLGSRLFDEVCSLHQGTWALSRASVGARFALTLEA